MRYVILENLRSAHNVGSIFRTADGAGVDKLFLVGTTPCPNDRFGRPVPEIAKTSLGAVATVPWEYVATSEEMIEKLAEENIALVAVEQCQNSLPWYQCSPPERAAFVFGNEVDGVGAMMLEHATHTVDIPMRGSKESLNVGVSVGIILFGYLGLDHG